MNYKLTPEQKSFLMGRAGRYESTTEMLNYYSDEDDIVKRKNELQDIENKNKDANMELMDSCFFGPVSAAEICADAELQDWLNESQRSPFAKSFLIMALEDMLGKSTTMEYDKSKNAVTANTSQYGDKLVFDEKDVELGFWDKLCAFFGIATEHAKKVAFAKESMEAQKNKLDDFNKAVVKQKKDKFVENHKEFAQNNESIIKEADSTENAFKALFFGEEEVKDYKFKNGDTLSAVAACIAMYHQEKDGKDIANMSVEEINKPENADLRKRLLEIGNEYQEKYVSEKSKMIDEKIAHLDDFVMTSDKLSARDKSLLKRVATDKAFDINWDKLEAETNGKDKKEMAGAKALVMLKVKGQLRKVAGKEFPNGQKNVFYDITDKDMDHLNAFKDVREYKMFMDEMSAERYDKAAEHLGKLTNKVQRLEGFEMKPENYNAFLEKADSIVSQKELNAPSKENKEMSNEMDEMEMDEGMSK